MSKLLEDFIETEIQLIIKENNGYINFETNQTIERKPIIRNFDIEFRAVKGNEDWNTINNRIKKIRNEKENINLYISFDEINNTKYRNYYILKKDNSNNIIYQAIMPWKQSGKTIIDLLTNRYVIRHLN